MAYFSNLTERYNHWVSEPDRISIIIFLVIVAMFTFTIIAITVINIFDKIIKH